MTSRLVSSRLDIEEWSIEMQSRTEYVLLRTAKNFFFPHFKLSFFFYHRYVYDLKCFSSSRFWIFTLMLFTPVAFFSFVLVFFGGAFFYRQMPKEESSCKKKNK